MADEWRETALGQLGRIVTGKTPPSGHPEFFNGDIPFVTPTDFDGRRKIISTERNLTEQGAKAVGGSRIPAAAVMVSCIGSDMGKAAIAGRECVTNQQINSIVVSPENAPLFVYYNLSTRKTEIRTIASGSAQPILNKSAFGKLEICLPPFSEQRAIAHILGTLDDKIELNRRMNETLEVMARALFKSWFVDFDPVRAKAQRCDAGLPKALAELFPDAFEVSEDGEIPFGWQAATLLDFCLLNPEVWSKVTRPDNIDYVDLSNTKWGQIEAMTCYSQRDAPSRAQRVLRPRDTIVGTVRPGNGSYALISQDGLTGSTGFSVLRPLRTAYTEFTYLAATAPDNIDRLAHLADGGAYPAVRPEVIAATRVARAGEEVVNNFSRITAPMLTKIAVNNRETRSLASIRDALLPELISGELRIKDAEKFVAA